MTPEQKVFLAKEIRIARRNVGLNATCGVCRELSGDHCRAHFVEETTELRAALEGALLLIDKIADCAHDESCPAPDCENGDCECGFDEERDETVHEDPIAKCTCVIAEAQLRAKNIRHTLALTFGRRTDSGSIPDQRELTTTNKYAHATKAAGDRALEAGGALDEKGDA